MTAPKNYTSPKAIRADHEYPLPVPEEELVSYELVEVETSYYSLGDFEESNKCEKEKASTTARKARKES